MAEHIENGMKKATKTIIQNAKFVSLTSDEIISMDNASWASVHGYIVQDWCHIPLLLNVKHVLSGSKTNSLTLLIMNYLMTQGGLHEEDLASRLVYFGVDGISTFQGFKSRVIVQIQQQYVPFVTNVHCMAHKTNLAVQITPKLHTYLYYLALKHFYNVCMFISATTPKDTWSLPNWQGSWKPRATKYYEISKLGGYP
jgi:hypothetical protein